MALCPFAKHLLIPPPSSDPRITARAAILHVDAGGASSLFSFFRDRSGGIESHFHIRWTGVIEQYRDTGWQADANFKANDFGISIETQGFGGGKWTKRQLRSIKRLLLWLHETHDIPLQRIPTWDGSGVGYHVQFGSPGPWTPVSKSCPGPERIKQYNDVLVPWMNSDPQDEPDADLTVVAANLHNEQRAVDRLGRLKFDAALVSEAHHRRRGLRKLKGRYLTGPQRGPSQEVGILLRGLSVRGFASTFLSRAAKRFKRVGKERWGHDAVVKVGRRQVALVVAHPVAGARITRGTLPADHPLVKRYAAASRWVDDTIAGHKAAGREVVFAGDVQVRPSNDRPWSMYRVFAKHGMSFHNDGIDVVAWTGGLSKVSASSHDIGSDHPAVQVGLNINRKRK